jgi:hypothetical protein
MLRDDVGRRAKTALFARHDDVFPKRACGGAAATRK